MSQPDWKQKIGTPRALKASQNRDSVLSGRRCSETKLSDSWKNSVGIKSQIVRNQIRQEKLSRPMVLELKTLTKKHGIKLGQGWSVKSDEFLTETLNTIIKTYE